MVNFWTLIFGTLSWVVVESLLYNPMHKWGKFWAKESGMAEKMNGQQMTTGDMLLPLAERSLVGFSYRQRPIKSSIGLPHSIMMVG